MRTPLSSVPLSDPMSRTRQPAPSQVSLQWKRETEGSKSTTSLLEWVPMLQTGPSWTTTRGSRPASRRTSSVSLGTTSTTGCALRVPESRRSAVGGSSVKRAGGRRSMPPSMMPRRFSVRSCIGRVGVVAGGAAWLFGSALRTVSVSVRVSPCAGAGGPACPLAPFVLTPGAMRSLWVSKRASDQCRTQMHYARKGIVTEEMAYVATRERVEATLVRDEVARGRLVIPANVVHTNLEPMGIGIALGCKVNANNGNSAVTSDVDGELRKLSVALKYGADTVMDLSTGGDIDRIRVAIVANSPVPIGTVPVYQVLTERKKVADIRVDDFIDMLEHQAKQG